MEKISVTIITFNEEDNIRRCLESVSWADEIVVVDSHSTDRTVHISREYTQKVIIMDWLGYVAQKNMAVDQASHSWIFSIDADEEVSPSLRNHILQLREKGFGHDGYRVARKVLYLGKWIEHCGWYPDYKIRLFHREKGRWSGLKLHEKVLLKGSCGQLNGDLNHYSYANIRAHIRQINRFTDISSRELYEKGHNPSMANLLLNPFYSFFKCYVIKRGFLDRRQGLFIAIIGSFYVFLKYLKLWELHIKVKGKR